MTAPQHEDTTASSEQGNSHVTQGHVATQGQNQGQSQNQGQGQNQGQKLQRCWFVTLGLLGGFGFVTSQMSLAIAETDTLLSSQPASASDSASAHSQNFADSSYAADSNAASAYTLTEVNYLSPQPLSLVTETVAQEVTAQPLPAVDTFMDTSVSTSDAVASLRTEAASAVTPATAAPSAVTPSTVTPSTITVEASAVAPAAVAPAATTPALAPTVADTATPTFTYQSKPAATKMAGNRNHPLAGLIEANGIAAPVSAYAHNRANSHVNAEAANARATLVSSAAGEAGIEPTKEATPAAVPDILPAEPAAPAAPPIVNIEPAIQAAPPVHATEIVPAALPESANLPEEYNSVFVDPTDYSIGATEAPSVVVSEQSTGCEFTVGQNQGVPNGACGVSGAPASVANSGSSGASGAAIAPNGQQQPAANANAPVASARSVNVGPVSFSAAGIQLSTSAAGREYLNRSVRPLVSLQAAERFIFPLAIPSPITSLFGFRLHPISGDQRFHAGTDIGAEQGTPVLAAQNGTVAAAEYSGGYGLMVVLRHKLEDTELESRYAHLAEIFVEPGTEVKKGDIIGLVGSTGNSTGPHLHFEMRQLTADGWLLVNPDGIVQASLANLVNALNNPMATLSFNFSDFNLSNLRAGGSLIAPSASTEIPTFPVPGQDGIPFRPAQPNAS
ncbi:MAG: M23 family metallopeptidase [Phormidesmis sp.]